MPEQQTKERAAQRKRRGNAPTTQAGEFVKEEMHHVRSGKHGVRSKKQAIAIGLSKARRSGVEVPGPKRASRKKKPTASTTTRPRAERASRAASPRKSPTRATKKAAGRSAPTKRGSKKHA